MLALVGGAMAFGWLAPWQDFLGFRHPGWQMAWQGDSWFWCGAAWASLISGCLLIAGACVLPRLARFTSQLAGAVTIAIAFGAVGRVAVDDFHAGAWLMFAGSVGLVASAAIPRLRKLGVVAGVALTIGCFAPFGSGVLALGAGSSSWAGYYVSSAADHRLLLGVVALGPLGVIAGLRSYAALRSAAAVGGFVMAAMFALACAVAAQLALGWGFYVTVGAGALALVASFVLPRSVRTTRAA